MDIIKVVTGGNCMSSYLNPGNLQQDCNAQKNIWIFSGYG